MSATPPPVPRAFLFDLDDTLVPWQTVAHWQWAWRPQGPILPERHARSAIKHAQHAWDRRRWDGLTGDRPPAELSDYRQHLKETLVAVADRPLPAAEVEAVIDRFLKPAGGFETYPDAGIAFDGLRARGDAVGIITFLPEAVARAALKRAGLPDPLLLLHGEDAEAGTLPSAAAFRAACRRLGSKPSATAYVGDLFWSDVRAAGRAGLEPFLIDRTDAWPRVTARKLRTLRDLLLPPSPPAPVPASSPPPEGGGP